ncbi:MAG: aspartate carbamoyltransferase catalytic subunit [Acidimicrobiales bacterium]
MNAGKSSARGERGVESVKQPERVIGSGWPRHLLSVSDLDAETIGGILRVADAFAEVARRPIPKVPTLRGKTVATLFAEESTRTRLSFETAARRLSADVMSLSAVTSSIKKGESLRDTAETMAAMGVDALIVRHPCAGAPNQVAGFIDAAVINAGDGAHEHPTQALLDCYTIRQHLAEASKVPVERTGIEGFVGLRVCIVGDIRHSRVARSCVWAFSTLGCEVTLVGPGGLMPPSLDGWPIASVSHDIEAVLPKTDVCYMLRLQAERGSGSFLPSAREYTASFGLTARRAALLPEDAVVMHPGPMIRGLEIADEVADLPRSVILRQVANGIAVRMAVLYLLLGTGDLLSEKGELQGA